MFATPNVAIFIGTVAAILITSVFVMAGLLTLIMIACDDAKPLRMVRALGRRPPAPTSTSNLSTRRAVNSRPIKPVLRHLVHPP